MIRELLFSAYKKATSRLREPAVRHCRPVALGDAYLLPFLRPESVVLDGDRLILDNRDSLRLSLRPYELLETEILKQEILPGQTAVDVGANIGYYTLLLARAVGANGRVFAFEPVEENAELLAKSVALNRYQNVTIEKNAVTDTVGHATMFLSDFCCGNHTLFVPEGKPSRFDVETTSLDQYFGNYGGTIDFVKIDVEGGEGHVLRGMEKLLEANRNMKIATEYWPYGLQKSGIPPQDFLDTLQRHRFDLYLIDEQSHSLRRSSPTELLRDPASEPGVYVNLLCLRRGTEPRIPKSGSHF